MIFHAFLHQESHCHEVKRLWRASVAPYTVTSFGGSDEDEKPAADAEEQGITRYEARLVNRRLGLGRCSNAGEQILPLKILPGLFSIEQLCILICCNIWYHHGYGAHFS